MCITLQAILKVGDITFPINEVRNQDDIPIISIIIIPIILFCVIANQGIREKSR
jgi:hypothetical protein